MYITVNNREMLFLEHENDTYTLPTLYKKNSRGSSMSWSIYVKDDSVWTETGLVDGKQRTSKPTVYKGKNKGRCNETTPREQAFFQAYTKWLDKHKENYAEKGKTGTVVLPMLAYKYLDHSDKLVEPFGVSPKLDGVRAIIKSGVTISSRKGLVFTHFHTLKQELEPFFNAHPDIVLDGELYIHGVNFNHISGCARSVNTPSPYDSQIEFWVFDIVDTEKTYRERVSLLNDLSSEMGSHVRLVPYVEAYHKDVDRLHGDSIQQGFEGLILRNLDSLYKPGKRDQEFLKHKVFEDAEFVIVGVSEGTGNDTGTPVFVCDTGSSGTFNVRPKGTIEYRTSMFLRKHELIGKMLTVRYFDLYNGIPRFPVGISIRDYE